LRKSADVLFPYLKEKGGTDDSRPRFEAIHSLPDAISSAVGLAVFSMLMMVFSRYKIHVKCDAGNTV
jgi:hypothetical protein